MSANPRPSQQPGPKGTLWRPYAPMLGTSPALRAVATGGARIRLADGRELVDGIASWWTACHGYNHPHITAAIKHQAETMPHVMFGGLSHAPAEILADRLAGILPGGLDHLFFSDSGSVAVEVAMKMAVQYWRNLGQMGRTRFVSFRHGYHGDTLAAMSVCDPEEGMHRLFTGYVPEQHLVSVPRGADALATFDNFLKGVAGNTAAVIIEPLVQAAGGLKFHDAETLTAIAQSAARHGLLFIADEIATGFGRTGTMFACDQAGVTPDIVCIGKALSGGALSLAATAAGPRVVDAFRTADWDKALMHGPTFMANPLACAAANASLDLFETEPRLAQVARIEAHLRAALAPLRAVPGVADVRVMGAIGAVELERIGDLEWLKTRFIEQGVWLRPFGNVVYTMPPFILSDEEMTLITDAMVTVVREWSARTRAA